MDDTLQGIDQGNEWILLVEFVVTILD